MPVCDGDFPLFPAAVVSSLPPCDLVAICYEEEEEEERSLIVDLKRHTQLAVLFEDVKRWVPTFVMKM